MPEGMKLLSATEHQIQTSIIQFLGYKGYYVMRLNSGAIRTDKQKLVRLAERGTPDLLAFKSNNPYWNIGDRELATKDAYTCDLLFIEVKRPGKEATDIQKMKMQELTEYGARCIVATSIDDVEKQL